MLSGASAPFVLSDASAFLAGVERRPRSVATGCGFDTNLPVAVHSLTRSPILCFRFAAIPDSRASARHLLGVSPHASADVARSLWVLRRPMRTHCFNILCTCLPGRRLVAASKKLQRPRLLGVVSRRAWNAGTNSFCLSPSLFDASASACLGLPHQRPAAASSTWDWDMSSGFGVARKKERECVGALLQYIQPCGKVFARRRIEHRARPSHTLRYCYPEGPSSRIVLYTSTLHSMSLLLFFALFSHLCSVCSSLPVLLFVRPLSAPARLFQIACTVCIYTVSMYMHSSLQYSAGHRIVHCTVSHCI